MTKSDTTPVFKNQNGTFKDGDWSGFIRGREPKSAAGSAGGTLTEHFRRIHDEWGD